MAQYTFQSPDGKTYTVEGDHEPSQEEMAAIAGSHTAEMATIPESSKPSGYLSDIAGAARNRIGEAEAAANNPKLNKVSTALKIVGQVPGFLGDVAMSTLKKGAIEPLAYAGHAITPEAVENPINKAGSALAGLAARPLGAVAEKYGQFKEANPNLAASAEGLGNIASIMPMDVVGSAALSGARGIASEGLGMAGRGLEKTAEKITPALTRLSLKESPLAKDAMVRGSEKAGRVAMAAEAGQEANLGKDLLRNLEGPKFNQKLIETNRDIWEALQETPDISLENTIKVLEGSKVKGAVIENLPNARKANAKIDEYISALRGDKSEVKVSGGPGESAADFEKRAQEYFAEQLAEQKRIDLALKYVRESNAGSVKEIDSQLNLGKKKTGFGLDVKGTDLAGQEPFKDYTGLDRSGYAETVTPQDMVDMAQEAIARKKEGRVFNIAEAKRQLKELEKTQGKYGEAEYDNYLKGIKPEQNPLFGEGEAQTGYVSPQEFFKIRQHLDSDIPWDAPEKKIVDAALVNARQAMAQDLIDKAPAQYKPAMEDMAKKLQARDAILDDIPGKNIQDKMDHVESYIKNIHGIGKANRQEALKKLDEIFGTNYYQRSLDAALGKQFGESGVPSLGTMHKTGFGATQLMGLGGAITAAGTGHPGAALGGLGMAALQSPYVGTRVIGGLRTSGRGLQKVGRKINPLNSELANLKIRR
jgi:hypothetical protein